MDRTGNHGRKKSKMLGGRSRQAFSWWGAWDGGNRARVWVLGKQRTALRWSKRNGAQLVPLVLQRRQPAPSTACTVVLGEAGHCQGPRENQVVVFTTKLIVYKINLYSNLPPYLTGHLSVCPSLQRCTLLPLNVQMHCHLEMWNQFLPKTGISW